jgi:prepilin-type N-terminal cleavage/methylation domain-containing protein
MDQKGFSLIEILVAIGIVSIISAAISSMISNMYDMENRLRVSQDGRSLQYELEQLTKQDMCGIVNLDTKTINNTLYDTNKPYAFNNTEALSGLGLTLRSNSSYGMLDIIGIQLEPWLDKTTSPYSYKYVPADDTAATAGAATRVKAQIKISYVKRGERSMIGTINEPKQFDATQPVFLVKSPSNPNIVIDCYSEESENIQKEMCTGSLGGEWDPSVTPPACKLTTADSGNSFNCLQTDSCGVVSRYIK